MSKYIQELSFCASVLRPITVRVSRIDAKCIVVTHVCVCVYACVCPRLHAHSTTCTDPDVNWGMAGGRPNCALGRICDRCTSIFQTIVRSGSIVRWVVTNPLLLPMSFLKPLSIMKFRFAILQLLVTTLDVPRS